MRLMVLLYLGLLAVVSPVDAAPEPLAGEFLDLATGERCPLATPFSVSDAGTGTETPSVEASVEKRERFLQDRLPCLPDALRPPGAKVDRFNLLDHQSSVTASICR